MFDFTPPQPPMLHILKKEIKIKSCDHLTSKNVKKDLVLYKVIDSEGKRHYFGTCSLCYLTNNSRLHFEGIKDD